MNVLIYKIDLFSILYYSNAEARRFVFAILLFMHLYSKMLCSTATFCLNRRGKMNDKKTVQISMANCNCKF